MDADIVPRVYSANKPIKDWQASEVNMFVWRRDVVDPDPVVLVLSANKWDARM